MGMDVSYGLMYGTAVYGTLVSGKDEMISVDVPQYDSNTGQRIQDRKVWKHFHTLLMDITSLGKAGDKVDSRDIDKWVRNQEDIAGDSLVVSNDYFYFGFRAFDGEEPYIIPQNSITEFVDAREKAKLMWEALYPQFPGKYYLYLKVSV